MVVIYEACVAHLDLLAVAEVVVEVVGTRSRGRHRACGRSRVRAVVVAAVEVVETVVAAVGCIIAAMVIAALVVTAVAVGAVVVAALTLLRLTLLHLLIVTVHIVFCLLVGRRADGSAHDGTSGHADDGAEVIAVASAADTTDSRSEDATDIRARIGPCPRVCAAAREHHDCAEG